MRGAAIITTACLGVSPGIASACVIELAQCRTDGGMAFLYEQAGSVVLFNEWRDGGGSRSILVECTSREGVMVEDDPDDYTRLQDAEDLFRDVMFDDRPQTLDEITRSLRRDGIAAVRVQLSAGHCGCDLPRIPPPPSQCPDF